MTRKILVPVDLVDEQPPWLGFALDMAQGMEAEIILLHVVDYVPTALPVDMPAGYPMPKIDDVREVVEQRLQALAAKVESVKVTPIVEVGSAAREIVAVAAREGVYQIVIPSHGRRALARLVLGSVAERVARTAPCPVTIVRTPKPDKE